MSSAEDFQNALARMADDTARAARRIANRRNITKADKAVRLAALLNRSNAAATALGDSFASRQLEDITGKPVPAKGIVATDDSERLLKAARTAMETRGEALDRVERLARSESLHSARSALTEAVTGRRVRGGYIGWVRQTEPDACDRCTYLARNGRVWPASHRIYAHPNCVCTQRLVIVTAPPKPVRKRKVR